MNRKLFRLIFLISLLPLIQSCSKDDENEDEFLKEFNLPKEVTKPTLSWSTDDNGKYANIAGFVGENIWLAVYDPDTKKQLLEYSTPMIHGFKQKFYYEFGKVKDVNVENISIFNFVKKQNGIIWLVNYLEPTEIISTISGKEKRIYCNRYDTRIHKLRDWSGSLFIGYGSQSTYLFDENCNKVTEIPIPDNIIEKLISIDETKGLEVTYPHVVLYDITNGKYIWYYRNEDISREFVVKDKTINISNNIISFTFDIVYVNGDMERKAFKLNKLTGELVD